MVLTLRQLLDRIRPAGTPGAATEAEGMRQRADRTAEVAAVTALLAEFEKEADAIVASAELDAEREREAAREQARHITTTLPDRLAVARAEVVAEDRRRRAAEEQAIRTEADSEVERLNSSACSAIPRLVDASLRMLWDEVPGVEDSPG